MFFVVQLKSAWIWFETFQIINREKLIIWYSSSSLCFLVVGEEAVLKYPTATTRFFFVHN